MKIENIEVHIKGSKKPLIFEFGQATLGGRFEVDGHFRQFRGVSYLARFLAPNRFLIYKYNKISGKWDSMKYNVEKIVIGEDTYRIGDYK